MINKIYAEGLSLSKDMFFLREGFLQPNVLRYPLLAMETSGFGGAILSLFNCFAVKVFHAC